MSFNNEIKKLSIQDENNKCIDCLAVNPHWSSISLGVFICLECASKHRSYGVKISRVRSVNMDNWTEEMYLVMKEGGNKKFREFMERNGLVGMDKLEMYSSDAVRKYRIALSGPEKEAEVRKFVSRDRKEERKEKPVTTYEKMSNYFFSTVKTVKEKSCEYGSKLNTNYLSPAASAVKEKANLLQKKWNKGKEDENLNKEGNINYKIENEFKETKTNYSKWD
ncbi:GTPase-activating protein 8 [Gurleya vavrai]